MTKIGQKGVIKALFCFVLFIWLSSSLAWAQAKGYGVEVRARSSLHTSTQPGRIISVSVLITSYQPSLETFIEEIGLPEGWQPLMPPGRFSIPARGSVTRVVAFQIPPSAQAKDYEVVYSVKSRRDYGVYDEEIFTVSILAVEGMEIVLVKKPVAIIGGQHYEADLQLINKSNTTRTYFLHLPDRDERYPATITPTEVTLDPGKSADLKLKGRIFEGTTSRYHFVEVQAVATGDEGPISTSVIVDLDVIPRGGGELDIFHVLPTELVISAMGNSEGDGANIEWSGWGYLDEERTRWIEFLFRGPDVNEYGIYGDIDEYWLNYFTETFDLYLGDQGYPLSRLTSLGSYGRGLGFAIKPVELGWGGGAHFLKSRWGYPDKKEFGFYISQKIRSDLEVRLNMLQKERKAYGKKPDMEDTLWTVSAEYRPWAHTLLELEYGLCDTDRVEALDDDKAYRIYLRGRMNGNIPYSIARIRAGTDFWGYYHDYDYTSATIGYPFSDRLQGNVSWYQYKDNLNLRRLEGTTQTYEELGPVPDLLFKTDIFEKYVLYKFISISFFSFAFCEFFLDTDKKGRDGMVKGGFPALLNVCGIYIEEKIPIHFVPNGYSPVRNLSNKPGQVSFPNQLDKAVRLSAEITLPENGVHKGNVYVNKVMEVVENRINLFSIDNEFKKRLTHFF
jgi:hypothetical protein